MACMALRIFLLVLAGALACLPAAAEPVFPGLTGRVVDEADILTPQDEQALSAELEALEAKSSDQLVVVTLPSLQGHTIEDFGYRLGRHWGIGTAELSNGVLLIVAANERKVRIEVGYGLEGVLTDALSSIIIQNAILPRFREGDFPAGIKDGVRDIALVLTGDATEVEERARFRQDADEPAIDGFTIMLWTFIALWVAYSLYQSNARISPAGRRRSGTGRSSGGSSWSSGSSRSSGGFSGRGGSFGGGGSSGSW
jgi:uncharacterized protein